MVLARPAVEGSTLSPVSVWVISRDGRPEASVECPLAPPTVVTRESIVSTEEAFTLYHMAGEGLHDLDGHNWVGKDAEIYRGDPHGFTSARDKVQATRR
jgi:hypothetical protein